MPPRSRIRTKVLALVATAVAAVAVVVTAGSAGADAAPDSNTVAARAHQEPATPGTPCSISARACVDLESQQAWLIRDGKVIRGPVRIASGGAGQETPIGHSFRVYRKDKDHVSGEFNGPDGRPAPMPYSVFFADGGVAFHGGDRSRSSAGCIKLEMADAKAWFNELQNGDKVQVVNASEENIERQRALQNAGT